MKIHVKLLTVLFLALAPMAVQSQTTFYDVVPGNFDAAWKVISQPMSGYVLAGNRYFNSPNPNVYMMQFSEYGDQGWLRTHASGLNLVPFWKNWCKSSSPLGYFVVTTGTTPGGAWQYFAFTTNNTGQKIYETKAAIDPGTVYSGCIQGTNGGFIAVGRDNNFNLVASRYTAQGAQTWHNVYPGIGWGWAVAHAPGGGYLIAGTKELTKIDVNGNLVSNSNINLPNMPGGAATDYGEFEEIYVFPDATGFAVTGTAFGGNYTSPYIVRYNNNLGSVGAHLLDPVDFTPVNTPVAWIGNAVKYTSTELLVNWKGPINAPHTSTVRGAICNNANGGPISTGTLTSSVSPREAFMVRDHGARYVLAGTTSNFRWFSWITTAPTLSAPKPVELTENVNVPNATDNELTRAVSKRNSMPAGSGNLPGSFDRGRQPAPASRVFYSELNVYPNPASDLVYVGGKLREGTVVRIIGMDGRTLIERTVQADEMLLQLDVANLKNGVYAVQVSDKYETVNKKFFKN